MKNKVLLMLLILVSLLIIIIPVSAATFEKADNQSEFRYSSSNYKFNVYLNDVGGFILTHDHKQIKSVKVIDINNKSKTLKNNIDFKNNKTLIGYRANIDFNKRQLVLDNLKKVEVTFVKQPDLVISKISKNKKEYLVKITNKGDLTANKNHLGMYAEKNGKYSLIKKAVVPKLQPKKSVIIKVKIVNAYIKSTKVFHVDYTNRINEINEDNNFKVYV